MIGFSPRQQWSRAAVCLGIRSITSKQTGCSALLGDDSHHETRALRGLGTTNGTYILGRTGLQEVTIVVWLDSGCTPPPSIIGCNQPTPGCAIYSGTGGYYSPPPHDSDEGLVVPVQHTYTKRWGEGGCGENILKMAQWMNDEDETPKIPSSAGSRKGGPIKKHK